MTPVGYLFIGFVTGLAIGFIFGVVRERKGKK